MARIVESGLLLTAGSTTAALLSLVRNIVIARLISVEDFGIASTLAITMAIVEMASNMALDRLLVQAREGEERVLMSTLHGLQAVRGVLGAVVLFLLAGPLASLFGVPEVAWAYQALAVIPLLRGLAHLDMFRRQRKMQFLPSVGVEVSAQLLSTAAALPLALAFGDYRAMLYVLIIQQFVFTLVSHWVAVRPYRWAGDLKTIRKAVRFGWPLLLDSVLMFGIIQGERLMVGTLFGMTTLGWYSVAFSLTLVPASLIAKILGVFLLPQLAQSQDDPREFKKFYLITMQACLFAGLVLSIGFAFVGPSVLTLFYGAKYESAAPILVWLAIMYGFRIARSGASVVALAMGNTTTPLIANCARVVALPVAALAVNTGAGVLTLVNIGIAGEGIALLLALFLLRRRLALPLAPLGGPIAATIGSMALISVAGYARLQGSESGSLHLVAVAVVASASFTLWSMRELRSWGKAAVLHR